MVDLSDSLLLGSMVPLKNRIVMPPITRTRASEGDVPNELMATYYGQRASAGLIIAEATAVAPPSRGYALTPGIYTETQRQGWRLVTDEVHRHGGTIFVHLWHVGRMAHSSLLPNGEAPWGVTEERAEHSDVFAPGPDGKLDYIRAGTPRRLRTDENSALVGTFAEAFAHARQAGFDGVEIHAASGYLFDQFMNSALNTRTDRYGGGRVEDRTRFLMEVADAAVREWGPGRLGVRMSPFGRFNSMPADPLVEETLLYVSEQMGRHGVAYLHAARALSRSVKPPHQMIAPGNAARTWGKQSAADPISQTRTWPSVSAKAGRWRKRTVLLTTPDAERRVTRTFRRIWRHAAPPRKFQTTASIRSATATHRYVAIIPRKSKSKGRTSRAR